jgi:hypothetical protein
MLDLTLETDFLRTVFQPVVVARSGFLAVDDLVEVLSAPNAADLFIGGRVDAETGALLLYRGNLESIVVPLASFVPTPGGPPPDPSRFSIADYGQTVKLGDYEASAEAILYEIDPDYRRRLRERRRNEDQGFGPSLRRLRIQRGLRQTDFPGITEREIGRIERGEVDKPHESTVRKIAEHLGVAPQEIEEY